MRLLQSTVHPQIASLGGRSLERLAARAIVLSGDDILLMYTERYHDYSLPGGGVNPDETLTAALVRELSEETGAQNIRDIAAFGCYEEYRPWYKEDADYLHMRSYCYTCNIDPKLGKTSLEDYEVNNGMQPRWVNIEQAIAHNLDTLANNPKAGMSIERESYLLQRIRDELVCACSLSA
ncbi:MULTISPECIES: NUDIX hydrolase [unclassified Agarivorans]|uniref:NUDIX hydrolase n=1 Tax=unclassified Agarivorans TaxID=2636026 RepID=UPI003D7E17A1